MDIEPIYVVQGGCQISLAQLIADWDNLDWGLFEELNMGQGDILGFRGVNAPNLQTASQRLSQNPDNRSSRVSGTWSAQVLIVDIFIRGHLSFITGFQELRRGLLKAEFFIRKYEVVLSNCLLFIIWTEFHVFLTLSCELFYFRSDGCG